MAEQKPLINFASGPAKIPEEVLKEVQDETFNYSNTRMNIMEVSHRSANFNKTIRDAEQSARDLLHIPDNYKVLFLQGGGTGQFAAVPFNLLSADKSAHYFVTGTWSLGGWKEATRMGKITLAFPPVDRYLEIPSTWENNPEAAYYYYCDNETVNGIEWETPPFYPGIPLISDMSSNILTKTLDISKYGCIFAGAQKTFGPAGVTLVIVNENLLGSARSDCPTIMDWAKNAKAGSLFNTPPTHAVYVVGKMFQWIKREGGVEEMERRCEEKATLLYNVIHKSNGFYRCPVAEGSRSRVNVVFRFKNDDLEAKFVKEAADEGIVSIKGHRSVGGMRAALYNAITVDHVKKLADFMNAFKDANE